MTVTDAPTAELGYPGGIAPSYAPLVGGPSGYYVEGLEANIDLRFPASALVYDRMRKEDGQVGSVARAISLPILNATRRLVGGRPEVRAFVERELGLDLTADEETTGRQRRRREGIVLREHYREALLCLWFGFMPFEQVYEVGPAAPGLEDPEAPGRLYAHLRKLAPRMPRTLSEVAVSRDGGLAGIRQLAPLTRAPGDPFSRDVFIPVDRLVMYVNEREGADWHGNSLLRAAYKHWLIKDVLIRLGAQIVERNGMGIPFVTYARPELKGQAIALAKAIRAGAEAGAALPEGITVQIVGVSGSTADELPRVKYHDESIGRSLLAMFLNLGHDNGARALGATFVDYFLLAVNAVIRNLDETVTEHVIRDLVELNYGPDEPYPVLRTDDLTSEATPTAEALKMLADAGLITPDHATEQDLRRRYRLPALTEVPLPQVEQELGPTPDGVDAGDDGIVVLPTAAAAAIDALERETHVGPYAAGDPLDPLTGLAGTSLEDRLAGIVDALTALRALDR